VKPLEPWFPACFVLPGKCAEDFADAVQKIQEEKMKSNGSFRRTAERTRPAAVVHKRLVAS
jgi:hypothetical protein